MVFPENSMVYWQFLKIIGEFHRTKSRFPPNFFESHLLWFTGFARFALRTSCFDGKTTSFLMIATSNDKHKEL